MEISYNTRLHLLLAHGKRTRRKCCHQRIDQPTTLNPRALIAPSSLSCPSRDPRPSTLRSSTHCVLYFFVRGGSVGGRAEEEVRGWRHPQLWTACVNRSSARHKRPLVVGGAVSEEANCARGSYPILSDAYMTVVIGFRRLKPHSICGRKMTQKYWRKKRPV